MPGHQGLDHGFLAATEGIVAKYFIQDVAHCLHTAIITGSRGQEIDNNFRD